MSERDGFQPGVPSWVDVMGPDPSRLTDFYGSVLGWDERVMMPPKGVAARRPERKS